MKSFKTAMLAAFILIASGATPSAKADTIVVVTPTLPTNFILNNFYGPPVVVNNTLTTYQYLGAATPGITLDGRAYTFDSRVVPNLMTNNSVNLATINFTFDKFTAVGTHFVAAFTKGDKYYKVKIAKSALPTLPRFHGYRVSEDGKTIGSYSLFGNATNAGGATNVRRGTN